MRPWSNERATGIDSRRGRRRRDRGERETLKLLAHVSETLSASLDYGTTVRRTLELAIPLLGSFGFLEVHETEADTRRVVWAPDDDSRRRLLERTAGADLAPSLSPFLQLTAPELVHMPRLGAPAEVEESGLLSRCSPEDRALLQALGAHSVLGVPLRYHHRDMGTLVLFWAEAPAAPRGASREHHADDLALAGELAQRAAAALENARLHRQMHEAVRKRDEFLSVASHELKTPLTTLELHVSALLRNLKLGRISPQETDTLVDRLGRVEGQVQRLNHVIEDLLDASRMGGERLRLSRAPLDLAEVTQQGFARVQSELQRVGSEVELDLEPVTLVGDRARLEQVVVNLLSNAARYGGGKSVEVRLRSLAAGGARLTVSDHGIGIAPEDQARVFERFERAVSPRRYTGLGMGLWVARQILEAHGGTIGVLSIPGVGSSFTVDLPG